MIRRFCHTRIGCSRRRTGWRAFTLIELLVVVAIIALLVSMLMPTLSSAKALARRTICQTQMRRLGQSIIMYANDNDGWLPPSSHSALAMRVPSWGYSLSIYFGVSDATVDGPGYEKLLNSAYRCPEDRRRKEYSYAKNVYTELIEEEVGDPTYRLIDRIPAPSTTIIFGEFLSGSMADHFMAHFWEMGAKPEVDVKRHPHGLSNYAYLDGHASPTEFIRTYDPPNKVNKWHPGLARE